MEHFLDGEHHENSSVLILVDSALVMDMTVNHLKFAYHNLVRKLKRSGVPSVRIPEISVEEEDNVAAVVIDVGEDSNDVWLPLFEHSLFENYVLHSSAHSLPNVLFKKLFSPVMSVLRVFATTIRALAQFFS